MATKRPPFLTKPYSAYEHREVPEDDKELTRVGPGTPAGEYLRRFWHPVAHIDQLTDVPLALKIMGEELVLFRDKSGRLGLVEAHCPHRGTSFEYGKIEERGIRCCYHSWLIDIDGKIRWFFEHDGQIEQHIGQSRIDRGLSRRGNGNAGYNLLIIAVVHKTFSVTSRYRGRRSLS